jgi:hypothetical protein
LAGPYWNSKNRLIIGTETVLLFVLTVMQIELAVYITQWNAALFDAIEQRSMAGVKHPGSRTNPDLHWRHNGRRCPFNRQTALIDRLADMANRKSYFQMDTTRPPLSDYLIIPKDHDNPDSRIA